MTSEFVKEATARLAKEKGFNVGCRYMYGFLTGYNGMHEFDNYNSQFAAYEPHKDNCSAPTQDLLQRWLREKHNLHIAITLGHDEKEIWYDSYIYKIDIGYDYIALTTEEVSGSSTYEEAMELGLFNALNFII